MSEGPRYAPRCRWLRLAFDPAQPGELLNRCTHIARKGMRCVGPFLDDTETHCRLWEGTNDPAERPMP